MSNYSRFELYLTIESTGQVSEEVIFSKLKPIFGFEYFEVVYKDLHDGQAHYAILVYEDNASDLVNIDLIEELSIVESMLFSYEEGLIF